jgi:hypothetical protein
MDANAPAKRTRGLSCAQRRDVARWWAGLTAAARHDLRRDGGRAPRAVLARFVEAGEADEGDGNTDFYEYLVGHEILLGDGRAFHICSAHEAARACLARGRIPAEFRCPRADAACPMRALAAAAAGRDVRLSLAPVAARPEDLAHG